jgi:beta-N-acetylhexosaminidase
MKPVIFGCSGLSLTDAEKRFFEENQPAGFIIFKRNIDTSSQVKKLTREFRECVGYEPWVLVDQEGGRVARLAEPNWPKFPAVATLINDNSNASYHAVYQHFRNIGNICADLGINMDCAPVLDIRFKGAHDIVGDRAFGYNATDVAFYGKACCYGLADAGVLPVIKHIPGHGRAMADSHFDLPVVNSSLGELKNTDFEPFRKLADAPLAMTAHITYTAIDDLPATLSKKTIKIIREYIGFDGVLMTDDLSMQALSGSFAEKTQQSLHAGCDIILHCNGNMEEMQEIAENLPKKIGGKAMQRVKNTWKWLDTNKGKTAIEV